MKRTVRFQTHLNISLPLIFCLAILLGPVSLWGGQIDLVAGVTVQNSTALGSVRNNSTIATIDKVAATFSFKDSLGVVFLTVQAPFASPTLAPGGVDTATYPVPSNTRTVALQVDLGAADIQRGAIDPNPANNLATFDIANKEADLVADDLAFNHDKANKDDTAFPVRVTCRVINNGRDPATPVCFISITLNGVVKSNLKKEFPKPLAKSRVGDTVFVDLTLNLKKGDKIGGSFTVKTKETDIPDPELNNNNFPRPKSGT